MRPVLVLGDVMVDVVARMRAPLEHGSDTPARVRTRPGGAGANVAAWLAVAGAAADMTISVEPASAAPLREYRGPRFLEAAGTLDLLLPNRDEATALTGEDDPATAARTLARSAREVVVTLGAGGALWTDGRGTLTAAARSEGVADDTTGAGDAFAAGWLAARLNGARPAQALAGATALADRAIRLHEVS